MSQDNINEVEVEKKSKKPRVIGIIALLLIIGFFIAYSISGTFRGFANNALSNVPILGDLITGMPTDTEIDQREDEIARYYVEQLDAKSAADKLYIVKDEDLELYNSVVRKMDKISAQKTDRVLDHIREIEIRRDTLTDLYEEVESAKADRIKELATELESMTIRSAINNIMDGSDYLEGEVERLFLYLNDARATDILYYVDGGTRSDILYKLSDVDMKRKNELERLLDQKRISESEKDTEAGTLANIHELGDREKSATILGTSEEIDINVLARTFMMMSEKSSAEIIYHIEDTEFLDELKEEIKLEESVRGIDQSSLVLINQIESYLREYNSKLDKLVTVYEKMDTQLAADSLLELLDNQQELTVMEIREQEGYQLSDYKVAVDIMKKTKARNLKDILENMTAEDVARISRILSEE